MEQVTPRAPWLTRLPPGVWTALTWCAAELFAYLLFATHARPDLPGRSGPGPDMVVSTALALPLGVSRRWPLAVSGVLFAESCVVAAVGAPTWPFFAVLAVLVGYLAATWPRRTALLAAGGELLGWLGQWVTVDQGNETSGGVLRPLVALAAMIAIAWLAGNSIRQQRDYSEALSAQAVTAERLRIARELHDMVAHSIGVIAFQAGAAALVLETQPANARKALGAIETTSRETLAGLRRMLVSLRRADQESAPAAGLEALDRLAETTADAGVRVQLSREGQVRPLPPEVDVAAFRIIQESVTNTVRHSGARHCRVRVAYGNEELAIEITDDGRGVAPRSTAGSGFGITGMRERVALLGGRFSAGAGPEGGFRVAAELPV